MRFVVGANKMAKRGKKKRGNQLIKKALTSTGWGQSLLESVPDAMVVVDPRGKIVLLNARTEKLFGYPRGELLGRGVERLVPKRFREQYRLHLTHFFETAVRAMGAPIQLFGMRKDGAEFPVDIYLRRTKTGDGVWLVSVIRDVTEQKMAEESRLRLQAMVAFSEDAIISTNLEWIITSWNAGSSRIFGYKERDVIGQPIYILIPPELWDEETHILEKLKAGEHIERCETIRLTKMGKRINVSLTFFPIRDSSGRIVAFSKIVRDITERKLAEQIVRESEERFQMAAQAGNMYSYEWDVTMEEVSEHTKVLGMTEPLHPTHQKFLKRVHPDDRKRLMATIAGLTPENPTCDLIYRVLSPDGAVGWQRSSGRAMFDGEGKMLRVTGIVADITDLKRAEHAVVEMTRKLVDAQEQERTRIARELHDDISQRLALMAIELDQVRTGRAKVLSAVRTRIGEVQKQMQEVSLDVQTLSHDLHPSKLEYLGVVTGIKAWCREFAERQSIEIEFSTDVSSVLPLDVGVPLFRVLQEALHNAVKHSGAEQVKVQLQEISNEIQLIVSDSGAGFDLESALRGKGLGLISMRERVRLVNGTISIESKPRSGTTVHVRVPVAPKSRFQTSSQLEKKAIASMQSTDC